MFQDLFNNRIKDVTFSWDKVLNFDGETGPYVQYTFARASSILRKAQWVKTESAKINPACLIDEYSQDLLKSVSYTHVDVYKRQQWARRPGFPAYRQRM